MSYQDRIHGSHKTRSPPRRRWASDRGRSSNRKVIRAYVYPRLHDDEAAPWRTVLGVSTSDRRYFWFPNPWCCREPEPRQCGTRSRSIRREYRTSRRKMRRISPRTWEKANRVRSRLLRDLIADEENERHYFLVPPFTFLQCEAPFDFSARKNKVRRSKILRLI